MFCRPRHARGGGNPTSGNSRTTALSGGAGGPFHRAWLHLRLGNIADLEGQRSAALEQYKKVLSSSDVPSHQFQKGLAERFTKQPYRGYATDG